MKLLALSIAVALTAVYGYASQAAMAMDAQRFYRFVATPGTIGLWYGGTLAPLTVTVSRQGAGQAGSLARRPHRSGGSAALSVWYGGTLPPITVTARRPRAARAGVRVAAHDVARGVSAKCQTPGVVELETGRM